MPKALTIELYIERSGKAEPFNGFTAEELQQASDRLSKTMSRYYTAHPEQLQ